MTEVWKPVVDASQYEVSDLGRVRHVRNGVMRPQSHKSGYPQLQIGLDDGRRRTVAVHLLVARAFLGLTPVGHIVDHRNRVRTDARLKNLRFLSRSENSRFAVHRRGKTYKPRPVPDVDAEWRLIPGYPEYLVSSCGCVRRVAAGHGTLGQPLRFWIDNAGYRTISLCVNGKKKNRYIHDLVCLAFHGPKPEGLIVDHDDHNKENNRSSNLEYVTRSENSKRFERQLKSHRRGTNLAKLTVEDVTNIKCRMRAGESSASICRDYPVAPHTLSAIKTGRTWRYVV